MSKTLKAVHDARVAAQEELRALYAEAETRELTPEESEKESALGAQIQTLEAREAALIALDEGREEADAAVEARTRIPRGRETEEETSELRSLLAGETRAAVTLPTAFTAGAPGVAGFVTLGDMRFLRGMDTMQVPEHAGTYPVATFGGVTLNDNIAQATDLGESPPVVTMADLTVTKAGAWAEVASELIDNIPEAERRVRSRFVRAANRILIAKVVAALEATDGATSGGAGAVTADDLIDLTREVDAELRSECVFILGPEVISMLEKAKGTGNDHYYYDIAAGVNRLRGYEIREAPLDAVATGNVVAAFGHPEAISVAASNYEVSRDDSVGFKRDVVTFRGIIFAGAAVNDADWVKTLTVA